MIQKVVIWLSRSMFRPHPEGIGALSRFHKLATHVFVPFYPGFTQPLQEVQSKEARTAQPEDGSTEAEALLRVGL